MGRTLPFGVRSSGGATPPPDPHSTTLASKIQVLLLTRPEVGRVLEDLVDRLLAMDDNE